MNDCHPSARRSPVSACKGLLLLIFAKYQHLPFIQVLSTKSTPTWPLWVLSKDQAVFLSQSWGPSLTGWGGLTALELGN